MGTRARWIRWRTFGTLRWPRALMTEHRARSQTCASWSPCDLQFSTKTWPRSEWAQVMRCLQAASEREKPRESHWRIRASQRSGGLCWRPPLSLINLLAEMRALFVVVATWKQPVGYCDTWAKPAAGPRAPQCRALLACHCDRSPAGGELPTSQLAAHCPAQRCQQSSSSSSSPGRTAMETFSARSGCASLTTGGEPAVRFGRVWPPGGAGAARSLGATTFVARPRSLEQRKESLPRRRVPINSDSNKWQHTHTTCSAGSWAPHWSATCWLARSLAS